MQMKMKPRLLVCNLGQNLDSHLMRLMRGRFDVERIEHLKAIEGLKNDFSIAIFSDILSVSNWASLMQDFVHRNVHCHVLLFGTLEGYDQDALIKAGIDVVLPLDVNARYFSFAFQKMCIAVGVDDEPILAKVDRSVRLNAVGRLAAGLAQEVNNPLAIIQGSIDLMRDKFMDNQLTQEDVDIAFNQHLSGTRRIAALISSLRGFSRSSVTKLSREFVEVGTVVDEVLSIVSSAYRRDRVYIDVDFDCQRSLVYWNRNGIEQIILALVANAKESMINIGGTIQIRVVNKDDDLVLSVIDAGVGIPADHRERVFDSFFSTKSNGEGLGLGLSFIKRIIEDAGGTIAFENNEPQGTQFHVRLPTAVPKFLIVEDDPFVIATYKSFVEKVPCIAAYAGDGELACKLFESQKPDLVLLDYELPKKTGLDVLRFIRERDSEVPVVVITANTQKDVSDQFMEIGANEALLKPVGPERLIELTGQYLFGRYNRIESKKVSSVDKGNLYTGKKVLVVDDEEMIRRIYTKTFSRLGVICLEAGNGKEAVEVALKEDCDLVILDYNMPVMNGIEALKLMKKNNPYLPVIMVTGSVGGEEIAKLSKAGARKVLFKPLSTKDLRAVVLSILEGT